MYIIISWTAFILDPIKKSNEKMKLTIMFTVQYKQNFKECFLSVSCVVFEKHKINGSSTLHSHSNSIFQIYDTM